VRPLTDTVNVRAATVVNYSVTAALSISIESDTAVTLAAAQARLAERLADVKIGKNVTLGMIIAALSVDGVEDVTLTAPIATVSVLEDQVAVVTTMGVSVV
jgi:phage-related baseplate assembly protein